MERLPELVFDEAFKSCGPEDRNRYRGRNDLSGLPAPIQRQLRLIQTVFNASLQNEKFVPEHAAHPPFHVDYVDSDVANALAFRYEDYSFIAITVPLIYAISDACLQLSKSRAVSALLRFQQSSEDYNPLHAALFYNLCAFVVGHEFTHHVHGHVSFACLYASFPNEILDAGSVGNLKSQIGEVVADGYSIYHTLANLFDGGRRTATTMLRLDSEPRDIQDEVLFGLAVTAIAGYLFLRPVPQLDEIAVYKNTHPPQVVRMDCIMQEAMHWCRQNEPDLQARMTPVRCQQLMRAAIEATAGSSGLQGAREQADFLRSQVGAKYHRDLAEGVNNYKQSWGKADG